MDTKTTSPQSRIIVQKYEDGVPIFSTEEPAQPILFQQPKALPVEHEVVQGVSGAFMLHNVLSPEECKQFIDLTEKMGYDLARISTFGGMVADTRTRNNKRVMWQSVDGVWQPIWERIRELVPQVVDTLSGKWRAHGLNERLRFYRYSKGEVFVQHYDGCFPRNSHERSFLTFIIYLNEDFDDGHTTFYPRRAPAVRVKPKQGSALLFWHGNHPESPLHEGSLCSNGTKYVLRSDVMYTTN